MIYAKGENSIYRKKYLYIIAGILLIATIYFFNREYRMYQMKAILKNLNEDNIASLSIYYKDGRENGNSLYWAEKKEVPIEREDYHKALSGLLSLSCKYYSGDVSGRVLGQKGYSFDEELGIDVGFMDGKSNLIIKLNKNGSKGWGFLSFSTDYIYDLSLTCSVDSEEIRRYMSTVVGE